MSRGLSKLQHLILEILDEKKGMTSSRTLKNAIDKPLTDQSFYRSLQNLEKRGEIRFYRGGKPTGGLVCKTHGNVLLIDADAPPEPTPTFPNIALMKLSAYHKARRDRVTLQRGLKLADGFGKYDIAYISSVFKKNARAARRLAKLLSTSIEEVHLGGSGVDLKTTLPDDIEKAFPDYELYPECDYSIGMTMRGCTRSCSFCIVKEKEGYAHPIGDIYKFYNPKFKSKKILLLDNNILALPQHFIKIANQIKKEGLRVEWNQGLDIRHINDENAAILKELHIPDIKFAWDDIKSEAAVLKGIEILKRHGINRSAFYCLVGYQSTFEDDLYKINKLRDLGQRPFVMPFNREELFAKDRRYEYLRNWTNARMIFPTQTFEEYVKILENGGQKLIASTRKLQNHPPPTLHGCEISSIEF